MNRGCAAVDNVCRAKCRKILLSDSELAAFTDLALLMEVNYSSEPVAGISKIFCCQLLV